MNIKIKKYAETLYDDNGKGCPVAENITELHSEKKVIQIVKLHLKAEIKDAQSSIKWCNKMLNLCK